MHYLLHLRCRRGLRRAASAVASRASGHARAAHARGELILAGALANPVDGAVPWFSAESPEPVAAFAEADPYVRNGLVTHWRIREWARW